MAGIKLMVAAVIGISTFALVQHTSLLGISCYYVGNLTASTVCLNPAVYFAPLTIAAVFAILGIADLVKGGETPPSNTP